MARILAISGGIRRWCTDAGERTGLALPGPWFQATRLEADFAARILRLSGFAFHEPMPMRTAFVRFRRELVQRGLDRVLFGAVTSP